MGVIAFALLLLGCNYDKPLTLIIAIIFTFLWYDFFSGVLHIVLDNPGFIKLPVLGEPCLVRNFLKVYIFYLFVKPLYLGVPVASSYSL